MQYRILVLNGPNLNLLGVREPGVYGTDSFHDLCQKIEGFNSLADVKVEQFQSNSESKLIDKIHSALGGVDFIVFNPAGFTHTSVALRDALLAVKIPFVEVHLSNVYAREPFRKYSYFSDIAQMVISGAGMQGYEFAINFAISFLKTRG